MEANPLSGTWKLTSYNYFLPNGCNDESVKIENAFRIYNGSHFSVYYEYENESTETCMSSYKLDGDKIEFEILCHTLPGYAGHKLTAKSYVEDKLLFHHMDINGYRIEEVYERLKG